MKNVCKSDMESFVRGEMLFIRDSLCNRYNGCGTVFETGDSILRKASQIAKHPVSKFDALIGQCITLPDSREILLYPLKPVDSSKCASVVYAQIGSEEPGETGHCKTFCLDGDLAKDHDVFVQIHEWADGIINGGVAA